MARSKSLPPVPPLPIRVVKLHLKLVIATLAGTAVAALPLPASLPARLLTGWNVGVLIYLVMTHAMMFSADEAQIRRRAAEQDEGGFAILLLTIVATLASLIAIIFELSGTKQAGAEALGPALLALTTIVLSWAFVHTIFALHYAHEYYGERRDGAVGGLNFPGDKHPDYRDFLYFSLVVGMTFQVSDVAITSKVIRRLATLHGAISFFFNLTVLALTVNTISNLIRQ